MTPRAQSAFDAAKAKPDACAGVDVSHLTAAERRELAAAGLSLSVDRKRRTVATYPARLRQADFRAAVLAKRAAKGAT